VVMGFVRMRRSVHASEIYRITIQRQSTFAKPEIARIPGNTGL